MGVGVALCDVGDGKEGVANGWVWPVVDVAES